VGNIIVPTNSEDSSSCS